MAGTARPISNFGRNISFTPRHLYTPRSEDEVLRILDDHRDGTIRVVGAGHSWNEGIVSSDALVDLRHLRNMRVDGDGKRVTAGAGIRIGALLEHLSKRGLTLPSIGLIDRQTVAGAVATGTHGSGRHSMSHHVESMRIACYGADGRARVRTVDFGSALRAARCSVGAMGVVLEVTLPCVPQYHVRERSVWRADLDAVLAGEAGAPLQQAYLMPHGWTVLAHERGVAGENRPAGGAVLYRVYWLTVIDVLLHLCVKFSASLMRSRRLVHLLYRRLLPAFILPRWRVTDRSDRQLLMRHDLFRHLEMEVFVPREHIVAAAGFVGEVLRAADHRGHELTAEAQSQIDSLGAGGRLEVLRGCRWGGATPGWRRSGRFATSSIRGACSGTLSCNGRSSVHERRGARPYSRQGYGGRRMCQSVSRWYAIPKSSTPWSSIGEPTICSDSGSPSSSKPQGIARPGCPTRLAM